MIRRALIAASAVVMVLASAAAAQADIVSKIKSGEIVAVSIPGSGVWPGRAMGIINAPAAAVFKVLADFARYDKFVPLVTAARRIDSQHYELHANFPWPVKHTRCKLSVRTGKRGGTYVVQWQQVSGTLKKYEGVAWIQPWGKGRALLTYQMLAVPNVFAPNALMTTGLRNAVRGYVSAVRKRVAQLEHTPGTNVAAAH